MIGVDRAGSSNQLTVPSRRAAGDPSAGCGAGRSSFPESALPEGGRPCRMRCATARERRHPDCTRWLWPGCWRLPAATMAPAARPAPRAPPPEVTVAHPRAERLVEWDEFTGRFEAIERVEVRARVSGYLNSVDFERRPDGREGPGAVRDRPAALSRSPSSAPKARSRQRRGPGRAGRSPSSSASPTLVESPAVSRADLDQRMQEKRGGAGEPGSCPGGACARRSLDLEFTRGPAPSPGGSPTAGSTSATWSPATRGTLLTTIVSLDPIYFVFDMSEADFLAYQRAVARGRAALDPRPRDRRRRPSGRRGRTGRTRAR